MLFFERFLTTLEETTKSLDERIVEESRDLLILATCRIFANLAKLQPSLDLEAVTAPIDIGCPRGGERQDAEGRGGVRRQVRPGRGRRRLG